MNKEDWRKIQRELLKKKNVVAVGWGFKQVKGIMTDEEAIVCSVEKKVPFSQLKAEDWIPAVVEGEKTDVIETGIIRALKARTDRWRPCLAGDTRISCNSESKKICDLEKGDVVYSFNLETFKFEKKKVVDKFCTGTNQVFKVITDGHTVEATAEHPFLVYKGYKKERNSKGQFCPTPNFLWVETQFLKKGDVLVSYRELPNGKEKNVLFGYEITQEFCKIVGAFIGDGFVMRRSDKRGWISGINWCFPKNDKVREKYEKLITDAFGKVSKKRYLRLYSHEIGILFQKLDLDYPAKEKHLPTWIFELSKENKIAFLEGYLDSDGHHRNPEKGKRKETWDFYSASKRLIEDTKALIESVGWSSSNVMRRDVPARMIAEHIVNSSACWSIAVVKNRKKPHASRNCPSQGLRSLLKDKIAIFEVRKIEKTGKKETFDIQVDGSPNYLADGFVVHNCPGGVSIGHEWITAGTLGCLVKRDGQIFILSNNHVLADCGNAPIGSAILQPGKYDGGTLVDRIATLSDFIPIYFVGIPGDCKIGNAIVKLLNFSASVVKRKSRICLIDKQQAENLVDAAIALPIVPTDVDKEILEIGVPAGIAKGILGMSIQKSGRTTGLTKGEILQTDVAVTVQYGEGKTALFVDQFMAGAMCAGGDSGSVVLDMERNIIGLLFAGSDNSTVMNPIQHVIELLRLENGIRRNVR